MITDSDNTPLQSGFATIIPHQVFGEIMEIARSDDPLQSRCQRTERRIAQFKADLKGSFVSPTRGRLAKTGVARDLRRAFNSQSRPPDHRVVFLAASDALAESED
jgi:hypothetical protein